VGAEAHRFDRRLFADRGRNDDERHVEVSLLENGQRIESRETLHRIVGKDDVPRTGLQRGEQALFGLHAPRLNVEAASAQRRKHQLGILLGIVD
jgi:hypothetical protein